MSPAARLIVGAVVLALAPAIALSFAPTVSESSGLAVVGHETGATPDFQHEFRQRTLPETQGRGVVFVLFFPAAVAAAPLALLRTRLARASRIVAAVALFGCCLLGALSIGLFYFPAAIAMQMAAAVSDRPGFSPSGPRERG